MRLFVLISRVPYPLEKGDKLRIFHQVKELSKHHEIILCALNDSKIHEDAIKVLSEFCKEIHIIPLKPIRREWNILKAYFSCKPLQIGYFYNCKAKRKIHKLIRETKPDHIYCQLIRVAEYVKDITDIPKTLDYQDAFSKGVERRIQDASFFAKPIFKLEYNRLLAYENKVFDYFDHKTIISYQDQELIKHPDKDKIHVIRNGVNTDFYHPIVADKEYDLIFSGNMNYPPNVSSARYIVNEILPLVWSKYPGVKLIIAGANPARSVQTLHGGRVEVTGWVDDMRECYAISKIFIAPMQIGIGLQNKLLEAMAMKLPCISSQLTNNALNAKEGEEILIGFTPQEYANHIFSLLEDSEFANRIATNGYNFIQRNYNWESITSQLEKLISSK